MDLPIWKSQDPSSERKMPKCLCLVTDEISVFNIKRSGWLGLKRLRDITKDSDFEGLNLTNHFCAQRAILSISVCNIVPAIAGLDTTNDRLVSSAKRLMFV